MGQILVVNKNHPLAVRREGWWKAGRDRFGGSLAYDLMNHGHAQIINPSSSTGWKPTNRPGGFGHFLFGGTTYLNAPSPRLDVTGSALTMGAWVYPTISNAFQTVIGRTVSFGSRQYALYLSSSGTGTVFVALNGVTNFGSSGASVSVSPGWTVNAWNRIVVTYDGVTVRVYINGVLSASAAGGGAITSLGASATTIGFDAAGSSFPLVGPGDDFFVVSKFWSFGEIGLDYAIGPRHYPGLLSSPMPPPFVMGGMLSSGSVGTAAGTSTAPGVGSAIDASAGTASGTSTAPATGAALGTGTGTASGASTAPGAGSALDATTGTAAGTASAPGVGGAIDASAGAASGQAQAPGAGSAIAAGSGTAAGTSTAPGVGASTTGGGGIGTAAGTSTAPGVGAAIDATVGTASGTSTAPGSGSAKAGSGGMATGHATASGAGASIGGVDLALDIPDGIRKRFLATPGVDWITGGMTEGQVPQKNFDFNLYISFHDITAAYNFVAGHPSYAVDFVFQFDCFAITRYDARKMADLLGDIFHPLAAKIPTQAGLIFGQNAMPGGGMEEAGIATKAGKPLYKFTRDFSFSVSRTRPSL